MSKEKIHKTPNNKGIRQLLIIKYGNKCMFLKAHIPERLKGTIIKSYRRFKKEIQFTFKEIQELESSLTLHHLRHKADGGELSEKNGALVNELAHRYIHSLPREQEEVVNDMLREYKRTFQLSGGILQVDESIKLLDPFTLSLDNLDDYIEIPITNYKVQQKNKHKQKKHKKQKPKIKTRDNKKKFNRWR